MEPPQYKDIFGLYSACSGKDQSVWDNLYRTQKKLERSEA